MTLPLSERVIAWVVAKLATAKVSNGYNTDIGNTVLRARRPSEGDLPCCAVWGGDEDPGDTAAGDNRSMKLRYTVVVDVFVAPDKLELAKADVKRALCTAALHGMEDTDGKIGGPFVYRGANCGPRPDGSVMEWVSLRFEAAYTEGYSDPTSRLR